MRRELADRLGIAESLEARAGLAFALGRLESGGRLSGQWARLREEIGSPIHSWERPGHDRRIASARAAIGNDVAFDLAWREGQAMEQSADG